MNKFDFLVKYEAQLKKNRCPIIYDVSHLSILVGYQESLIYAISNNPHKFYRKFKIRKSSGTGFREIAEPLTSLKEIQRILLDLIFSKIALSKAARAYKKGSSIRSNASVHVRQNIVMRLDIENFFGSIKFYPVKNLIYELGYTEELAMIIANLCCLDGALPQGAPTSAALSNIFMRNFDEIILGFCKENNVRYTRYADDMVFSGDNIHCGYIISRIKFELNKLKLNLSEQKTRIYRNNTRQIVTGVVVNVMPNATKEFRRIFWQEVYFIKKWGLDGHMRRKKIMQKNYINNLIGRGHHILFLNDRDLKTKSCLEFLYELSSLYS